MSKSVRIFTLIDLQNVMHNPYTILFFFFFWLKKNLFKLSSYFICKIKWCLWEYKVSVRNLFVKIWCVGNWSGNIWICGITGVSGVCRVGTVVHAPGQRAGILSGGEVVVITENILYATLCNADSEQCEQGNKCNDLKENSISFLQWKIGKNDN